MHSATTMGQVFSRLKGRGAGEEGDFTATTRAPCAKAQTCQVPQGPPPQEARCGRGICRNDRQGAGGSHCHTFPVGQNCPRLRNHGSKQVCLSLVDIEHVGLPGSVWEVEVRLLGGTPVPRAGLIHSQGKASRVPPLTPGASSWWLPGPAIPVGHMGVCYFQKVELVSGLPAGEMISRGRQWDSSRKCPLCMTAQLCSPAFYLIDIKLDKFAFCFSPLSLQIHG